MRTRVLLKGSTAKVEKRVVKIQNEQRLSLPGLVHDMDSGVFGKLFQILAVSHMLKPLQPRGN